VGEARDPQPNPGKTPGETAVSRSNDVLNLSRFLIQPLYFASTQKYVRLGWEGSQLCLGLTGESPGGVVRIGTSYDVQQITPFHVV
jgi:hypothetical protein